MQTRPGAGPGCSWMKRWDTAFAVPPDPTAQTTAARRRWEKWFWALFALYFVGMWLLTTQLQRPMPAPPKQSYESPMRIADLPLVAVGAEAKGIVAIGGRATGVIAVGGLAVGLIAIGGLALGGITLSGFSVGILALGGLAFGWWAVGGGAVGYYAFGGGALGGYAYAANGVALGYYEASGRQYERLLSSNPPWTSAQH